MSDNKLTAKQQSFINEYCIDKNATQAAIRAGYSKNSAMQIGEQNLRKLYIKAEIDKRLDKLAQKTEITAEYVINGLKKNYERAMELEEVRDREGKIVEMKYEGNVANRALELLGKHLGIFVDKIESKSELSVYNINNDSDLIKEAEKIINSSSV